MRKLLLAVAIVMGGVVMPVMAKGKIVVETQKEYTPDETIVYKSTPQGDLTLDVFYPNGKKKGRNRIAVVQFFGGGWMSGDPKQFYQQSAYYNAYGMVAISVDYRVIQKHKTTPFESVEDGKSAIRWVRQHAKELGVDPDKIVASGGSAGGHIAACTALIEGYDAQGENPEISSIPNVLVLFNPVVNTTKSGYGADKLKGKETLISPVHHVRENLPPTIVMHGTKDTTVPFSNAQEFAHKMVECGNRCELIPFEGLNHGFFNGIYFLPNNGDENFNVCMEESVKFIQSIF